MDTSTLFAKTPPLKLFIIASLPGAVSMLASALYQIIDGVFVGQFLGETAFAAINLAMPFVIINFSLADLIGVGSAVPISICLGRKQNNEANNIFTCSCIMIVATGVMIGIILFAAAPYMIRLMGAEGDFAHLAVQYMQVYAICSPVTTIIFAVDNYLRICGFIRGSMVINILTVSYTHLDVYKRQSNNAVFPNTFHQLQHLFIVHDLKRVTRKIVDLIERYIMDLL